MDKARQTAAEVLHSVTDKQAYANVALAKELAKAQLSDTDRRFVTELVYGAVKAWGTLDYILGCYVNRPLNKIPPMIRSLLRLALYQIFYLDKVPPSAAVNTAVDLAKKYAHPGTVKFVNAVLRTAVREPDKAAFPVEDKARHLSLTGMHPLWLVKRWIKQFGYAETCRLVEFDNAPAYLSLRTNTLKISRDELRERLAALGGAVEPSPLVPEGIVYRHNLSLRDLAPLTEGLCQVQDISSMLVAHILQPQAGEFIIDACSAPGGKTAHIAALMHNRGRILATDVYEHKLARVKENAARLGIGIIDTRLLDARRIGALYANRADRVLVDAPCSGLGVLRRRSDARWQKSAAMWRELLPLQREILHSSAQAVKPGGILVYSTCTMEDSENGLMIREFLQRHTDFRLEQTGRFLPVPRPQDDMVQLYPQRDGTDGFFIARLRKLGEV